MRVYSGGDATKAFDRRVLAARARDRHIARASFPDWRIISAAAKRSSQPSLLLSQVSQLQRMIGNQATCRLLARNAGPEPFPVIQRQEAGDEWVQAPPPADGTAYGESGGAVPEPQVPTSQAPASETATTDNASWWDRLFGDDQAPKSGEQSWWEQLWGGGGAEGAGPESGPDTGAGGSAGGQGTGTMPDTGPPEKGPSMKFTIGGVPFTFDLQSGQIGLLSKKVSVDFAKDSKQFWIPVAGPLGASIVVSTQAGISADASVSVNVGQEELPGPYASPAYKQTATIGGTLGVGPSVSGSVFVGAGAGARAVNVSGGVVGKVSATGTASASLQGSAVRDTFDTADGGWTEWSGAISMPITMHAGISADLSGSLRWNFITESGEWFSIKLGSYPVGTAEVKCTARAGIPGGEDLSDVSTKFEWAPPVVEEVHSGSGKPPWEGGGGAEGSGPGTEPDTSGGAGGAPAT